MNVQEIIYSLSISLQVTGSILLLIYFWGNTRDRIIHQYFPGSRIPETDKNDEITLGKERVQKEAVTIYKNRVAFVLLGLGYLIGIFGANSGGHNGLIVLSVAIMTVFLIVVVEVLCRKVAERNYPEDLKEPSKNVEGFVDSVAGEESVDAMFEDVFGKR